MCIVLTGETIHLRGRVKGEQSEGRAACSSTRRRCRHQWRDLAEVVVDKIRETNTEAERETQLAPLCQQPLSINTNGPIWSKQIIPRLEPKENQKKYTVVDDDDDVSTGEFQGETMLPAGSTHAQPHTKRHDTTISTA